MGSIPGWGTKIPHAREPLSLCTTAEPSRFRAHALQLEKQGMPAPRDKSPTQPTTKKIENKMLPIKLLEEKNEGQNITFSIRQVLHDKFFKRAKLHPSTS